MIYLDNAATTRVYPECNEIIKQANEELFFNPSAGYSHALEIKKRIENARKTVAECIGASPSEIYFTSCATESNNTVIKGAHKNKKGCIVISSGEHASIYNAARAEKTKGATLIELPLVAGVVDLSALPSTEISLASFIHVSNITGAINNIEEAVSKVKAHSKRAAVHSDGVAALGKIDVDVKKLGVDLYSFSGHKLHAPKGIGVLYVRKGFNINPLILGGGQESGMRSGTENVGGILALEYALRRKLSERNQGIYALSQWFGEALERGGLRLNRNPNSSPYIMSVICPSVYGENLMRKLAERGVVVGIGAACTSNKTVKTHIISNSTADERNVIRVSFSDNQTKIELEKAAEIIVEEYNKLVR